MENSIVAKLNVSGTLLFRNHGATRRAALRGLGAAFFGLSGMSLLTTSTSARRKRKRHKGGGKNGGGSCTMTQVNPRCVKVCCPNQECALLCDG